MKKYVVSSADWKKRIKLNELDTDENTIFEASTRAVEWALKTGKSVGILISLQDVEDENKEFICIAYKVLNNAGYYNLAEEQRGMIREEFKLDVAEEPLDKLIVKIYKASIKKFFCIAKVTEITIDNRKSEVPIVCFNLGLFEDEKDAKEKCKELNESLKVKDFVVKKMVCN